MRISDWSSDVCSSDLTAFGLVDAALEDFEAREGVFDAVAVGHLAQLVAVLGAFEAIDDARLARAGFAQLFLQLGDVALIAGQRVVEDGDLGLELLGHVAGLLLFDERSEEHTSELQSLMRISYAVFCLKK